MPPVIKNILLNYMGSLYVVFIGFWTLPLYLNYINAESYGLLGFFFLLQTWIQIFDLGISQALSREIARLRSSPENFFKIRIISRSLETVSSIIILFVIVILCISRNWIAEKWLSLSILNPKFVSSCIILMAIIIGLRLIGSIYRSGINAYEQQVWTNSFDMILATLRYPGALVITILNQGNIIYFFYYQLAISTIEQVALGVKFYKVLPGAESKIPLIKLSELIKIAPFTMSCAYTTALWIITTQLDKLLISKILPLSEYGYFTIVTNISGGILLLSSPLSKAILPKMTTLLSIGEKVEMLTLYRRSTRFVVSIVAPATLMIAFFPQEVIYISTGNRNTSDWVEPTLILFSLGNGFLTIGAFQYYLQYAHGKLQKHVIYTTASTLISVPLIIFATFNYGPVGAAWTWATFRFILMVTWSLYIHRLFEPGLHKSWIVKDVGLPILATILMTIFIRQTYTLQDLTNSRLDGLILITSLTGGITLLIMLISFSSFLKGIFREKI